MERDNREVKRKHLLQYAIIWITNEVKISYHLSIEKGKICEDAGQGLQMD